MKVYNFLIGFVFVFDASFVFAVKILAETTFDCVNRAGIYNIYIVSIGL